MERNPSHFRLPQLKVFAPRVLYYNYEPPLHAGNQKVAQDIVELLEFHTKRLFDASTNDERLCRALREKLLVHLNPQRDPAYTHHLAKFAGSLATVDCGKCCGSNVCHGTSDDSDNVDRRGLCITPIKDLFVAVEKFAREYYANHTTRGIEPEQELIFQTGPPDQPVAHDVPVDYKLSGSVSVAPKATVVKLLLHPTQFDRETMLAVLYILFHEMICHAFQGSIRSEQERSRAAFGDMDEFAEGWMDNLAIRALREFLVKNASEDADLVHLRNDCDALKVAEHFHHQRRNMGSKKASRFAPINWLGANVADMTQEYFDDLSEETKYPASPSDEFVRLSLDLNVAEFTLAQRRDWVFQIGALLDTIYKTQLRERRKQKAVRESPLRKPFESYFSRAWTVEKLQSEVMKLRLDDAIH
jgi:hypothetical protein